MKHLSLTPVVVLLIIFIICLSAAAQPPDEVKTTDSVQAVQPDTSLTDSLLSTDSTTSLPDSAIFFDSLFNSDETHPIDSALRRKREEPVNFFNIGDSVNTYLLSLRMGYSDEMYRSFYRDAADLIRYNPSNFIIEYQNTPVRKTLSPFTLPGNRMNVILNNRSLNPVEHLFEPDNMIDFDDIPTAPVGQVYNIEGPLGMVYGADNGTSSMILLPVEPDSLIAESKMHVDKGSFGYAYTKAMFANRYQSGQSIRAAVGYRKADGAYSYFDDDEYHQWGEIIYPINNRTRLNLNGRLYHRAGTFNVDPANQFIRTFYMDRFRRDRDLSAGLDYAINDNHKSSVEFSHQRSESSLDRSSQTYNRKLDIIENSMIFSREGRYQNYDYKTQVIFSQERFSEQGKVVRHRGSFDTRLLYAKGESSWMLYFKGDKVVGYEPAPTGMLYYVMNKEKMYLSASAGYSTKFPRLYELNLSRRIFRIYNSSQADYYESGNKNLLPEKQLTGNVTFGLGAEGDDLLLSVTGGKIYDGVDWVRTDSLPSDTGIGWSSRILGAFRAENRDIEFVNVTARQRLSWKKFLNWTGGASYHFVRIDGSTDLPYSPDYQFYTNLGLHIYLKKFDLHLYGFGEAIYQQTYKGYFGTEIGDNITLNARLSFRVKRFTFFYIFQNIQANVYELREDYVFPGRYLTYGVNWEFLD